MIIMMVFVLENHGKSNLGNLSPHLPGSAVGSVLQVPGGQCDFGVVLGKRSEILVANFLHLSANTKVKPRMMRDHFSIYVNFMQVRSVLFFISEGFHPRGASIWRIECAPFPRYFHDDSFIWDPKERP